jgi:membrane protein DedA with SNARE-associated domain
MTKDQFKNWMGVVLSAVVLGLAVILLMRLWKPQDATHWLLWGVGILIAMRSIGRIASLTKQINNSDKEE